MDTEKIIQIFIALSLRYIIVAGLFFTPFYILFKNKLGLRKIQQRYPNRKDYFREVTYSMITTLIFTAVAVLVFSPDLLRPYTFIYDDFAAYGFGYYVFSFLLMLLVHDTYFYWAHRVMHSRIGMKYFHMVHHQSTNPSPWAAFSFHPLEAVVEASIIFIFAFTFPVHIYTIITFMLFMTIYNVYGHLGWELYPKGFQRTWVGKWINTSVNHNQHHKKFTGNYGLYFLFWDRWMGTIRQDYDEAFDEATTPQQLHVNK